MKLMDLARNATAGAAAIKQLKSIFYSQLAFFYYAAWGVPTMAQRNLRLFHMFIKRYAQDECTLRS